MGYIYLMDRRLAVGPAQHGCDLQHRAQRGASGWTFIPHLQRHVLRGPCPGNCGSPSASPVLFGQQRAGQAGLAAGRVACAAGKIECAAGWRPGPGVSADAGPARSPFAATRIGPVIYQHARLNLGRMGRKIMGRKIMGRKIMGRKIMGRKIEEAGGWRRVAACLRPQRHRMCPNCHFAHPPFAPCFFTRHLASVVPIFL